MKKTIFIPVLLLFPGVALAQSSIDAYNLSQNELRGTARFMSMAGAFTALGGDLSTLNQNPAGIGVYRGSDVGLTVDINMMNSKTSGLNNGQSWSNTHADVNNFGYVGTFNIGNEIMQTFSWGISYGRRNSFERQYRGSGINLSTSLSNYVAQTAQGINPDKMNFNESENYNPYMAYNPDMTWLDILSYSAGIINPIPVTDGAGNISYDENGNPMLSSVYDGLFEYGDGNTIKPTQGTADFSVRERGYVDEYSINFGGNLANVIYWGLGLGITDLSFEQQASYVETLYGANVPSPDGIGIAEGNCDYELSNYKRITGTGVNVKFGLIYKPVNEFRIGFAIHSPTYYSLHTFYNASIDFGGEYVSNYGLDGQKIYKPLKGNYQYTDDADYDWNMKSPWRLMVGAAGVIGGRGIISADYEYQAYGDMTTSDSYGDFDFYNDNVKSYFKSTNTLRLGAEFRVTPRFSIRAGYSVSETAVKSEAKNSDIEVITTGCNPAYTLNDNVNYITAGLGYRVGGFYADLAYIHKHMTSTYHGFTSFKDYTNYWEDGASAKVTTNANQLVITLGYKF